MAIVSKPRRVSIEARHFKDSHLVFAAKQRFVSHCSFLLGDFDGLRGVRLYRRRPGGLVRLSNGFLPHRQRGIGVNGVVFLAVVLADIVGFFRSCPPKSRANSDGDRTESQLVIHLIMRGKVSIKLGWVMERSKIVCCIEQKYYCC